MDLVEKLASSGHEVLEAAANDWSKWSKLSRSKKDLEFFLKNNIVHLKFRPKNAVAMKEVVCTSNTRFIAVFSALKSSLKKKALKSRNDGIATKDISSIMTYNLIDNKYNTISDLMAIEIVAFLTISDDNIELLDKVANELLRRQVVDDLSKK